MTWHTDLLLETDKRFLWHPFTPMRQWCDPENRPPVLCRGEGVWLFDTDGNRYFDGNSSIWTNIHGHSHPALLRALREQSERLCHSSFLGSTNPPAIEFAEALVKKMPDSGMERIFYSDDGSTAIEVAIKMTCQFHQLRYNLIKSRFVVFNHAYHGDTLGASSLGGVKQFFERFSAYHFPVTIVNNAEELDAMSSADAEMVAAVVIEPVIQGVAGMKPWPKGMLRRLRDWCDTHGALLIYDEVMTGFGRTGTLFAAQQEAVWPDFLCLAKGITGGLMPLAATCTTQRVFETFLGDLADNKTFFYGHSYTGNALACAVALASLKLFETEQTLDNVSSRSAQLSGELFQHIRPLPAVKEIRHLGLIAGIELDPAFAPADLPPGRFGAAVCQAAKKHGLLTRPILDLVVFMPPLCVNANDMSFAIEALVQAIKEVSSDRIR